VWCPLDENTTAGVALVNIQNRLWVTSRPNINDDAAVFEVKSRLAVELLNPLSAFASLNSSDEVSNFMGGPLAILLAALLPKYPAHVVRDRAIVHDDVTTGASEFAHGVSVV